MRVVLDANVWVSALLSRVGAPARLVERWLEGELEPIVCPRLLAELERTLRSPKLRQRVAEDDAGEFVTLVRDLAEVVPDPTDPPPTRSKDPDDDYLIALAASERVQIVSGDAHLLALGGTVPVISPREALDRLDLR